MSDQALDEALPSGDWVRNEIEREQVLDLRRKDLARKMQSGQLRSRICGFRPAPGQPVQLEWKEWKRGYAALGGSAEGLGIDGELLDFNEKVGLPKNGLLGSGGGCDDVGS